MCVRVLCVYMGVYICTHACREGRGQHWLSLLYCFPPSLRQGLTNPGAHGFGNANWSPLPSAPALGDNPVPLHPGGAEDLNSSPHASQGGTLLLSSPASSRWLQPVKEAQRQFTVPNSDKLAIQIGISESEGESYTRQRCSRQSLILKENTKNKLL